MGRYRKDPNVKSPEQAGNTSLQQHLPYLSTNTVRSNRPSTSIE
jgi:hypothetical protein